jgi:hypothetical protein
MKIKLLRGYLTTALRQRTVDCDMLYPWRLNDFDMSRKALQAVSDGSGIE